MDDNCISKLKNDFILLEIETPPLRTDLYEEEAEYSFSNLLSDIGGLMGLWLGMSVMGIFEIFVIFHLFLKKLCFSITKKKMTTKWKLRIETC